VPPIFDLIQKLGSIPERDMFNTFNMGVGMSLTVSADSADKALAALRAQGVDAYPIGEITEAEERIVLC
jgi:phosphoribosylformylglycinamidine cyclo-ligase